MHSSLVSNAVGRHQQEIESNSYNYRRNHDYNRCGTGALYFDGVADPSPENGDHLDVENN